MPWPVYSERLILANTNAGYEPFTVPDGKRCIVTDVTFTDNAAAACRFVAVVNGVPLYIAQFLASTGHDHLTCRWVLYAGDTLTLATTSTAGGLQASGYLFDDVPGLLSARAIAERDLPPDSIPGL